MTARVTAFAAEGMRVLAIAARDLPTPLDHPLSLDDLSSGFTLLGLQAMIDPPRPEALAAVAACHRAGMVVKMITGDHPATAQAIGAQFGLTAHDGPACVTGHQLAKLPPTNGPPPPPPPTSSPASPPNISSSSSKPSNPSATSSP